MQPPSCIPSRVTIATEHGCEPGTVPLEALLVQVEFNNGMWWTMPSELSTAILTAWNNGDGAVSYVWDWEDTREGSYRPDGEATSYNRYLLDFTTMYQQNTDNNRTRKVRFVYVVRDGLSSALP